MKMSKQFLVHQYNHVEIETQETRQGNYGDSYGGSYLITSIYYRTLTNVTKEDNRRKSFDKIVKTKERGGYI